MPNVPTSVLLVEQLKALSPSQFQEVVSQFGVHHSYLSHYTTNQVTKAIELLQYAQQNNGGETRLQKIIDDVKENVTVHIHKPEKLEKLLKKWLRSVRSDCERLPLAVVDPKFSEPENHIRLQNIYTNLDVFVSDNKKEIRIEQTQGRRLDVTTALNDPKNRFSVLLGDPGSGKSTLVNYLTIQLVNLKLNDGKLPSDLGNVLGQKIPLRLILRDVNTNITGGSDALWTALHNDIRERLNPNKEKDVEKLIKYLIKYIQNDLIDNVLFLLDGLDEVPIADGCRERLLDSVKALSTNLTDSAANSRILVTARPYAYAEPSMRLQDFPVLTLAPLSDEQMKNFITQWYSAMQPIMGWASDAALQRAEDLNHQLTKRPDLKTLTSRPLLLTLTASLHTSRAKLPEDRADLYEESVHLLMYRWQKRLDEKNRDGTPLLEPELQQVLKLKEHRVRAALEKLAYMSHTKQGKEPKNDQEAADISEQDAILLFEGITRNCHPRNILEFLDRRAGLLMVRGNGKVAFLHRSFQEYLAACYLTETSEDLGTALSEQIKDDFSWWREVFLLTVGKTRQGGMFSAISLLNAVLPEELNTVPHPTDEDWVRALAVGLGLMDLRIQERMKSNRASQVLITRCAVWLGGLLENGALSIQERIEAGRVLGVLGDSRTGVGLKENKLPDIKWIQILAPTDKKFYMGKDNERHEVTLDTFSVSCYPITVLQYRAFIDADGYANENYWTEPGWAWLTGILDTWSNAKSYARWLSRPIKERKMPVDWKKQLRYLNEPVHSVTWFEAMAFCNWLGHQLSAEITLPTEAQWERSTAGLDGREYPWGNEDWNEEYANTQNSSVHHPVSVGLYPSGKSPDGVYDLAGNVVEWCLSLYKPYPYIDDERNNVHSPGERVLRGGSYFWSKRACECTCRLAVHPDDNYDYIGFRVVMLPSSPDL